MKYVYEAIGTFFLVLTVGMVVLNPNAVQGVAPLAIGSALMVMVYAGGHISGGMYNPAVALAVFLRGKLGSTDLLIYWLAQFAGGAAAALLVVFMKGYPAVEVFGPDVTRAVIAEFLFTFALCFVVLNVATASGTAGNSFYGLAIGFTVMVGAFAMGPVSDAAFNPAVTLGLVLMGLFSWPSLLIYLVAQLAGGVLAAVVFRQAHPAG